MITLELNDEEVIILRNSINEFISMNNAVISAMSGIIERPGNSNKDFLIERVRALESSNKSIEPIRNRLS
jgi:hypothetical protein